MATNSSYGTFTLILIGTKGSGKSSTGNCILEKEKFDVFLGTKQGTSKIQEAKKENGETDIVVIDTPGLRDIRDFDENMKKMNEPDNAVYAIVISIGRYTTSDKSLLKEIEINYEHILKKTFVLFTRGKELNMYENPHDRTIDKWLNDSTTLSQFIDSHKLPSIVFENVDVDSHSKAAQIRDVIKLCRDMAHVREFNERKTTKRKISVDLSEMRKAFGDKGVEFFHEKC